MKFETAEQITNHFIKIGWSNSTTFKELTLAEAETTGLSFATKGINNGRKYFKMGICNNIYNDNGKICCFDLSVSNNKYN